ncbi:intermembrane transport protein PqiB [soil metagenome]
MTNDSPPVRDAAEKPIVQHGRSFSPIWIIPILAALLGGWLALKYYAARGPEISVRFETAEGIGEGKTPVLCRSVNVGTVTKVRLTKDLKGVVVSMQMTSEATDLLKKDTQIWVVRPRYGGAAGISGLSTLVSGSYIALEPGLSDEPRRIFVGLEQPPVTPKGVPGVHVTLVTDEAGGIGPGSQILYKGLSAGKIETRVFHSTTGKIEFYAFSADDVAKLVRKNTRFWNASGIDVNLGANGLQLHTGTLESLLLGGVAFGEPEGAEAGQPVKDGTSFTLYASLSESKAFSMRRSEPYLLLFDGSVRGLNEDAPVEFRGVRLGTVEGISFEYMPNDPTRRVPVLIQIDPSLITSIPAENTEAAEQFIDRAVQNGLRATLKTGSLLTGQLYVDLDFQKDAPPAKVVQIDGYRVIPTVPSGLGELQEKATALLDKLNALPIEETVENATAALAEIKKTAATLQTTAGSYGKNAPLYQKLSETLRQLDETLRSLRTLTGTLERKPNSIIFGKPGKVPPPKGSSPP